MTKLDLIKRDIKSNWSAKPHELTECPRCGYGESLRGIACITCLSIEGGESVKGFINELIEVKG